MNTRFIFLAIAISSIGLVVLPNSVSMFAGQHNFYDTTQRGIQVPCEKCHSDIATELSQPGQVNSFHQQVGCVGCHVTAIITNEGKTQGVDFHSAAIPACMDCHDGSAAMVAGGLNLSDEAHVNFIDAAKDNPLMKSSNEACIGCHTHTAVNVTWNKPTTMYVTVDSLNQVSNISTSQ